MTVPYVPATYVPEQIDGAVVYASREEAPSARRFVEETFTKALRSLGEILKVVPTRRIHICCYRTSADARDALKRDVPPTMAMAPFTDVLNGLIVLHSPKLHPLNRDAARAKRLLAHELTHLVVAEQTESTKRLGDDNTGMRVSAWLNEGLAELVGFRAIGADDRIKNAICEFAASEDELTFSQLSYALDDLNGALRTQAFSRATGAVAVLARQMDLALLIQHIDEIERGFPGEAVCSHAAVSGLLLRIG